MPAFDLELFARFVEMTEDGILYEVNGSIVQIIGYAGTDPNLVIPETIDTLPVTYIVEAAFKNNQTLKNVYFGDTILSVGTEAFSNMSNLLLVSMSSNTQTLGKSLFKGSNSLEKLIVSSEASYTLSYYFGSDLNNIPPSLKVIKFANGGSNINNALYSEDMAHVALELADDMTNIPDYQFLDATNLYHVIIPEGVLSIGEGAFEGTNLSGLIRLPETLLHIKSYAFANIKNKITIFIPQSVLIIEHNIVWLVWESDFLAAAESKPTGWFVDWNQRMTENRAPVIWDYQQLVVTPERAFLIAAQQITSIGSVGNEVVENIDTSYNNINDTYTITMDVLQVTFGTGVFTTLQTLGVKDVNFGDGDVNVTSANVGEFLSVLQGLIGTKTVSGPVTRTLTFTANIHQTGQSPFNATFNVIFTFTEALYNQF
jgi:hypothetical protein